MTTEIIPTRFNDEFAILNSGIFPAFAGVILLFVVDPTGALNFKAPFRKINGVAIEFVRPYQFPRAAPVQADRKLFPGTESRTVGVDFTSASILGRQPAS